MIREFTEGDIATLTTMLTNSGAIHCPWLLNEAGVTKQMQTGAVNAIYDDGVLKGCLSIDPSNETEEGKQIYLWLFTDPSYRSQGVGRALWAYAWEYIKKERPYRVNTAFYDRDSHSRQFFSSLGFVPRFISQRMVYTGPLFPETELEVRHYDDCFFQAYTKVCNEAFFELRKSLDIRPYLPYPEGKLADASVREQLTQDAANIFLFFSGASLLAMLA